MKFENIIFEVADGIARITLNRPDKLNSFTDAMHAELRVALDAIQEDKTVRVLVLSGAGRGFCAGQDLGDRAMQIQAGKMPDIGNTVERNYKPLALRLQNLRVPTIAAVNGIAAGAGCSVALACDLVIASKSASFLQAFSKIGLIPDTGGTWFLPQRVGMARAMGLFWATARTWIRASICTPARKASRSARAPSSCTARCSMCTTSGTCRMPSFASERAA